MLERKPNTCKNISPTFNYLNFIFQIATRCKQGKINNSQLCVKKI